MTEKSQPRDLSKRYLTIPIGHLKLGRKIYLKRDSSQLAHMHNAH